MQKLGSLLIKVLCDDAPDVAVILRRHMATGLWFTQRRWWFFWMHFTISGPSAVIAAVQRDLDARDGEKAMQDAW